MTELEACRFLDQVTPVGLAILWLMANLTPKRYNVAYIARKMRTSRQRLAPVFDRLVDHGYLRVFPAGRHPLYELTAMSRQLPLFDLSVLSGMVLANQPAQMDEATAVMSGMAHAGQPAQQTGAAGGIDGDEVKKINLTSVVVVDQDLASSYQAQQQQEQQARLKNLTSDDRRKQVLVACADVGIGYPKNRALADKDWTTAERVRRTVRQCEIEHRFYGRWEINWMGQAISRLEDGIEPMTDAEMDAIEAEHEPAQGEKQTADAVFPTDSHESPPSPESSQRAQQIWQAARGEIELQMTKPTYETWVKPAILVHADLERNTFVLATTTDFQRDWLERKLLSSIRRSLSGITGKTAEVEFCTWQNWKARHAD